MIPVHCFFVATYWYYPGFLSLVTVVDRPIHWLLPWHILAYLYELVVSKMFFRGFETTKQVISVISLVSYIQFSYIIYIN